MDRTPDQKSEEAWVLGPILFKKVTSFGASVFSSAKERVELDCL